MKTFIILKISVLLFALVLTVLAIRGTTPEFVGQIFQSMGLAPAGGPPGGSQDFLSYNLCRTRIHAMEFPTGEKIEEVKRKWMVFEPGPRQLDYIAIEKWLGRYCRVHVQELAAGSEDQEGFDPSLFEPVVRIIYVNNEEKTLYRRGDVFRVEDLLFRSENLETALRELHQLTYLKALAPVESGPAGAAN